MKYTLEGLREVNFVLGGIGTGSIGLAGNGRLVDWEIRNAPNKGSFNGNTHMAIKCVTPDGKVHVRALMGDIHKELMGTYLKGKYSGYGFGPDIGSMQGFPHFSNCEFEGEYPIAKIRFFDKDFPVEIVLTAFNPLIVGDDKNSSIPAAFFSLEIQNKTKVNIDVTATFAVCNLYGRSIHTLEKTDGATYVKMTHECDPRSPDCFDATLATDAENSFGQAYWYRGTWMDGLTTYWRELEGRQHHTLDMELFGPLSWLEGFYLAALRAAEEMERYLGREEKAKEYRELFERGYKWTKENLFNGKYFIQKIDIKDKGVVDHFGCADMYWNDEKKEIKYQIGEGSSIDQMCAQWHANLCGLGDIFDPEQRKIAIKELYKNNFKPCMRDVTNMWRLFAFNDESATIICDYPKDVYKPIIPIPYCEEAMTGFEYQAAGLLISEGMVDEGLQMVRAVRDRHNGAKRNPYNEFECGSNYARSMASFALIPILSGFEFDVPHKYIGFSPVKDKKRFCAPFYLGENWGIFKTTKKTAEIEMKSGALTLERIKLGIAKKILSAEVDGKEVGISEDGKFTSAVKVTDKLVIKYN